MLKIRINASKVLLGIDRARGQLGRGALEIASQVVLTGIAQTFREEGSPAGSWPPLAESTRRRYARMPRFRGGLPGTHKLLVLTGRLRASPRARIVGNRAEIGSEVVYAQIHQRGGRGIPARPYLVLRPETPRKIGEAVAALLRARLKAAGFK